MTYGASTYKTTNADNSSCRLSELVETIAKKAIPEHQKNVIFEITADDQTGEDVEVPYVMLKLSK